jgi:flagellar protein FliO/FliZ
MDGALLLRAVIALGFVLGLLMLMAWGLRRFGGKYGFVTIQTNAEAKQIQIMEATMLDTRHRLLRVKNGKREHLIVLGGARPVVVESKDAEGNG